MPTRIPANPDIVPPAGWILVQDSSTGAKCWADPTTLKSSESTYLLSEPQQLKVEKLAERFKEQNSIPLEQWADNFSKDIDPDAEIRHWEHIADIFEAELRSRPDADIQEKKLIFTVLLTASMLPGEFCTPENVLTLRPEAARLSGLEQIITRYIGDARNI